MVCSCDENFREATAMKENNILRAVLPAPAGATRQCRTNPARLILVVDDDLLVRRPNTGVLAG